jgi:hypothetical protein
MALQSAILLVVIRVPVAVFRKNSLLTAVFSSLWRLINLVPDVKTTAGGLR